MLCDSGYFLAGWVRRGPPARVAQGGLAGIDYGMLELVPMIPFKDPDFVQEHISVLSDGILVLYFCKSSVESHADTLLRAVDLVEEYEVLLYRENNKNGRKRSENDKNEAEGTKEGDLLPMSVQKPTGDGCLVLVYGPEEKGELVPFDPEPERTLRGARHAHQFEMAATSAIVAVKNVEEDQAILPFVNPLFIHIHHHQWRTMPDRPSLGHSRA
ncbi:hypothetical protein M9H77_27592 [Catharanthus roseus]|uniref:Uncharacterized protein n=1 Tax=Catharanthus roseus TaxID=4058 RepID=A0ACC0AF30_CATRO|nr:hypothetical protein M9H77_27592 [Catharanthus roseus]